MTRRPATLRLTLTATTLALALLPTLLTGGIMLVYGLGQVRARVAERNEGLARALAGEVGQFLDGQRALAEEIAEEAVASLREAPAAMHEELSAHARATPLLQRLELLDATGRVLAIHPAEPEAVGRDLSREPRVQAALATGAPAWTTAVARGSERAPLVLVAPGHEWVVLMQLDARALEAVLAPGRLEGRVAGVVDGGGAVVAGDARLAEARAVLDRPARRAGGARSGVFRIGGQEWLGSAWPVPGAGWQVVVSAPLEQAMVGVHRLRLALLLLLGAFAVLATAASFLVAGRVVKPVRALAEDVRRVAAGAYQEAPQPPPGRYREVDDLGRAFRDMAAAVRSREEALARSERSYRTVVSTSLVGVARTAVDGTVVFCNDAMARFFGARSAEEVLGSNAGELYRDPAQRERLLAGIAREGKVTNVEIDTRGRDGVERTLLLNVTRDGDQLIALAVDISEPKRAAADRQRLEHQLLASQKLEAVGRLAGGIAHDFNNLLTAIIGYAGMLKDELGPDDPRRDGAAGILEAANRAAHLTHALLAYSRKQVMQARPVDVCEVVRTIEKLLRRIIGEDVELVVELPEGELPALADAGHLEQALVNLCTNSREAMPGGGRIRISAGELAVDDAGARARQLSGPGRFVQLQVEDTGHGMSRDVAARVFEPFYTTRPDTGTGLGLSIVYGIVRQHGGQVELESEPARGTRVTLLLPRHEGPVVPDATATVRDAPRGRETLLVAEDEPMVRGVVTRALQAAGYEVVEAIDGEDAVVQFAAHRDRIALCLLDVVMPRKNGREAAEAIAALRADVPILLASGYAADVLQERGHGAVAPDVIAKPFSPGELLRRVRERLDGAAARRRL